MNNLIKYIVYAIIIIVVFTGAFYSGLVTLLATAISDSLLAIQVIPLELRAGLFLIILGLMVAIGKGFIK